MTVPCAGACKVSRLADRQGQEARHGRKTLLKAGNAKLTLKFTKPRQELTATLKVTVEAADGKTTRVQEGEAEALTLLRYSRVVSGAKMSVRAAATASEIAMSLPGASPSISPREASARIQIGLTFTNASSALGSVSGSTKTLDRNVSGKIP